MTLKLDRKSIDQIKLLRASQAPTMIEMARDIGEDPATFFEGGDWSQLDIRPCDVRGVSFADAILNNIEVYDDQIDLILSTNPRRVLDPIVYSRSDDILEFPSYEDDRPFSLMKVDRSEYVKQKLAYEEMVDKGWNPPISMLKILLANSDNFAETFRWFSDICYRNVNDSRFVDHIWFQSDSIADRFAVVSCVSQNGLGTFDYSFEKLLRSIKTNDDFNYVWKRSVEYNRMKEYADMLIWHVPSESALRFSLNRMKALHMRADEDTYMGLYNRQRTRSWVLAAISRLAADGDNGAKEAMSLIES